MENILSAIQSRKIDCKVVGIISDRKAPGAEERASRYGMAVTVIDRKSPDFHHDLEEDLEAMNPDLLVLSGFLSILPEAVLERFPQRIINSHPAILPCFGGMGMYGKKVHEKVIASGARITGCTVHFVTGEVDGGPIISQATVPVLDSDTPESLQDRVKEAEHRLMIKTLADLTTMKYSVSGNRVIFR
jgi:phosphoribosylglycinamide formyltransferase-1